MGAIQLSLFDWDEVEAQCPRCGFRDSLSTFAEKRRDEVLADPRVQALSRATKAWIESAPLSFLSGAPMGTTLLGDLTGCHPTTALYHVRNLARRGLVQAIPKRTGGKYYHYRLVVNGNS